MANYVYVTNEIYKSADIGAWFKSIVSRSLPWTILEMDNAKNFSCAHRCSEIAPLCCRRFCYSPLLGVHRHYANKTSNQQAITEVTVMILVTELFLSGLKALNRAFVRPLMP